MLVVEYAFAMLDRKVVNQETKKDRKDVVGAEKGFERRRRSPIEQKNDLVASGV